MVKQNITANISLTGTGIFSFFGGIAPSMARLLGYEEVAMNLEQSLAPSDIINWTPIYLWLFILCFTGLVFFNYKTAKKIIENFNEWRNRSGDTSISSAIYYILYESCLGTSLFESIKYETAWDVLKKAIDEKKLYLWGIDADSKILSKIIIKDGYDLVPEYERDHNRQEIKGIKNAVIKSSNQEILFYGLLLRKDELKKIWPYNYRY